ncbi:MAG: hypothetical protein AB7U76_24005 [Pirellulales bacterium]
MTFEGSLIDNRASGSFRRVRRLAAYGALAVVLAACGARRIRAYSDPSLPSEKVAVLRTQAVPLLGKYLTVESLDGVLIKEGRPIYGYQEIDITPGPHVVEVSYIEGSILSTSSALVTFDAREGVRYEVQGMAYFPDLASAFLGKGQWVAWIVDLRTGEVVGGVKPE